SSAALETLAIVAYNQPITKGEIESIRGVNSDYSIQKLLEKELVVISGRNENMPGKPLVYGTSKTFMDYFGINSSEDLPKLKEVFAETLVEPTMVPPPFADDEFSPGTGEAAAPPHPAEPLHPAASAPAPAEADAAPPHPNPSPHPAPPPHPPPPAPPPPAPPHT